MKRSSDGYLTTGTGRGLAEQTFVGYACRKLDALCVAAGFDTWSLARARAELTAALLPWGGEPIGARPRQPSELSDDHFPLEFSLTFSGTEPEVRVLFEPQSWTAGQSRWVAARALHARLAALPGVSLARLTAIEDLFEPQAGARWSAWHSLRFSRDRPAKYKVYLNPEAQGVQQAPARVADALRRLGFARYADGLNARLLPNEQLKFFSLDLDDEPRARVKVYTVQQGATRESIARVLNGAEGFSREVFDAFWDSVPESDGPFSAWPVSTYLSLESGDEKPSSSTVHFPTRAYISNDRITRQRLCRTLKGADLRAYELALAGFAERPLEDGSGIHAYVSLGQDRGLARVTVYLACEAYASQQVGSGIRRIAVSVRSTQS
jgi:DMATS type aromatic prenyltransferase